MDESDELFTSRLDRDSAYRMTALRGAISRASQDGGLDNANPVDVLGLASVYYNWLKGDSETTEEPVLEKHKNSQND